MKGDWSSNLLTPMLNFSPLAATLEKRPFLIIETSMKHCYNARTHTHTHTHTHIYIYIYRYDLFHFPPGQIWHKAIHQKSQDIHGHHQKFLIPANIPFRVRPSLNLVQLISKHLVEDHGRTRKSTYIGQHAEGGAG